MLSAEGTGNKRITLVELPRIQGGPFHRGPGAHGGGTPLQSSTQRAIRNAGCWDRHLGGLPNMRRSVFLELFGG